MPSEVKGAPELLESDSANRMDSHYISKEKFQEADRYKHEYEELQRHDKRIRENARQARQKL